MDFEIPLISSSSKRFLNDKPSIIEVFDREPNGIIIRLKIDSKELFLPVTEINVRDLYCSTYLYDISFYNYFNVYFNIIFM